VGGDILKLAGQTVYAAYSGCNQAFLSVLSENVQPIFRFRAFITRLAISFQLTFNSRCINAAQLLLAVNAFAPYRLCLGLFLFE
jgi:hypothetical protein